MRRVLLATTLVAALVAPAQAVAKPVALHVAGDVMSPGPSLGPNGALWAEGARFGASMRFRSGNARAAKTLFSLPHKLFADNDSLDTYGVAQSTTRLAFSEELYEYDGGEGLDYQGFALLRSGPPSGPFPTLVGDSNGKHLVEDFRLSRDALVTDEIVAKVSRVFVRDLATRAPARQLGPDGASHGRVAGSYAAYALPVAEGDTSTTIVVVEWATGAEAYRVVVPFTAGLGVVDMALQDDGTVAIVTPSSPKMLIGDLAWASRADPALHVVTHDATPSYPGDGSFVIGYPRHIDAIVRIARNQVVYLRTNGQLALAGIATPTIRPVSFPDDILGADFDGTLLTYATPHCVYLDTVTGPPPAAPPVGTCPQLALGASFLGQPPGRSVVKASIECTSRWEQACTGSAVFKTSQTGARSVKVATVHFTVPAGKTKTLRFKLSPAQRRTLGRVDAFRVGTHTYHDGTVPLEMVATTTDKGHVTTTARANEDAFRY